MTRRPGAIAATSTGRSACYLAVGLLLSVAAGRAPAQEAPPAPPAAAPPPPTAPETPPERPAPVPTLTVGESVDGEIGPSDPVRSGRHADDYRLSLRAGQLIRIEMAGRAAGAGSDAPVVAATPRGLETYLEVYQAGESAPFAVNRPMSLRLTAMRPGPARLVFFAPADGSYVVRAAGGRGQTGLYRLSVTELSNVSRPPTPIAGGGADLRFDESSSIAVQRFRGFRYADHTFEGRAGSRVWIRTTPANPVVRLKLLDPADLPVDEQSGTLAPGSNALLVVIPSAGIYRVRAQVPMEMSGAYRLELAQARPPSSQAPEQLSAGRSVNDRLGLDSEVALQEESPMIDFFYKLYLLRVSAGETITVDMTSQDFDSVLEAGTMSVLGYAMAVDDDDSGGERNARLVLHPEREGEVYIRARSLDSEYGRFQLRVTRGEPASPAS